MLSKIRILIVYLFVAGASGCGLFSGKTDDVVLAPTEVGSPAGDAVTKDIGPAGGSLASSDGRFTLTVPQNALSETTTFSIQPITNQLKTGLGLAYRFGPNGKTFTTPLELAVRFDDHDLEGTAPEALSVVFQDNERSWHVLKPKSFDAANKLITVPIRHFTDFSFLARLRIKPIEATVRPGQNLVVAVELECKPYRLLDKILGRTSDCVWAYESISWSLRGPGAIEKLSSVDGVYYIAPAKKPAENVAWVYVTVKFGSEGLWNPDTGQWSPMEKTLAARITIQDQVYEAKSQMAGLTFSGTICGLDQPFVVNGKSMGDLILKFTPSSASAGSVEINAVGYGVTAKYNGTYTIEWIDSDHPKINIPPTSVTGTYGGRSVSTQAIPASIDLVPLENAECREG